MKPKTKIILAVIFGILILGFTSFFIKSKNSIKVPTPQETLAQCLKDNGVKFYGTFWCPHCQKQKQMFGRSASKLLPYIECSTPDGKGQLQICIDNKIEGYPTWEFTDGSRLTGEIPLSTLAEKSGCVAPN